MVLQITATKASSLDEDSIKQLHKINKNFLVTVNIVRDINGNANITESDITSTLTQVNTVFAPIGATFTICQFNYIDNFNYDSLPFNSPDQRQHELDPLYRLQERINMYFVIDADKYKSAAPSLLCGYATTLGGIANMGSIVIKKSCGDVTTVAHELGHFFGLDHPFENAVPELADESNCVTAGDKICDTPADPFSLALPLNTYINSNCEFIYTGVDANNSLYAPDVSNIMSYYSPCICLTFSHDQYDAMALYYLSHLTTW